MIHILLNGFMFDQAWGYTDLSAIIKKDMKVLMVPLSDDDGWSDDFVQWDDLFQKGKRGYEALVDPFRNYGISERQIDWLNYFQDDHVAAKKKFLSADIVVLSGSRADRMIQQMEDMGLTELLRDFNGILIGHQAGALVQFEQFYEIDDAEMQHGQGLGLLSDFAIDINYAENEIHLSSIIRIIEDTGNAVVAVPKNSGMLIVDGEFTLLGDTFVLNHSNLDDIYQAYDTYRYDFE